MERIATTFRIDPVLKDGLSKLSRLEQRSLNQLANQAIKEFVARRMVEVEDDLASTLEDLRAWRKQDPDFALAIAEFVNAEVRMIRQKGVSSRGPAPPKQRCSRS